jgi:isopenicillin N synthase-like dioxygenase
MATVITGNGPRHYRDSGHGAASVSFTDIPIIDFAPILRDEPSGRAQVATEIREACIEIGFFYLINHGVPTEIRARAFGAARRFFDLPPETKAEIHIAKSPHVRGYTPMREESFDTANTAGDIKESFDMAFEVAADHPAIGDGHSLYGPNLWPAGDEAFRDDIMVYYEAQLELSTRLLRVFALALDLPEDYFEPFVQMPLASMRLLHYPPQPAVAADGQIGAGAHSDYECFTILAQDEVGGLQVLNAAGAWIAAPPVPGAFVVNIADMMARWTNDRFVSTLHRVVNATGRDRYSIPFFFGPSYAATIAPLPSCISAGKPAAYPPVLAGQYLEDRFAATYNHLK